MRSSVSAVGAHFTSPVPRRPPKPKHRGRGPARCSRSGAGPSSASVRRRPGRRDSLRVEPGAAHRLAEAGDDVLALVEGILPAGEPLEVGLDGVLVEELAAGEPVDVGAQRRDAVLVGVLHAGLARERGGEDVVAEEKIAGGGEVDGGEKTGGDGDADRHPAVDGEGAHALAMGDDDAVRRFAMDQRLQGPDICLQHHALAGLVATWETTGEPGCD